MNGVPGEPAASPADFSAVYHVKDVVQGRDRASVAWGTSCTPTWTRRATRGRKTRAEQNSLYTRRFYVGVGIVVVFVAPMCIIALAELVYALTKDTL